MTALLTGLLLGLGGAAHCAAMCGPLVMAVGRRDASGRLMPGALAAYHAGRALVYVLLAVPVGLAGRATTTAGFDRLVAVVSGLALVAIALGAPSPRAARPLGRWWSRAVAAGWRAASRAGLAHPLLGAAATGVVNGCLPCGFVYAAAIAAAGFGSVGAAVLCMLGFGLGTAPVLVAIATMSSRVPAAMRAPLARLRPAALLLVALMLLARGLMPSPRAPEHPVAASHHHGS